MRKNNKIGRKLVLVLALLLFANSSPVSAHGWILNDRAYLGSSHGGFLNANMGNAAFEPQSVGEAGANALQNGFDLHQVITAGGPWNLNAFPALSEQTETRWHRVPMNVGPNDMRWHFTAPHRTFGFRYYITRTGWNPNAPLTFESFEYLDSFDVFEGQPWLAPMPVQPAVHTIEIPADRDGYHIILGVWDVADAGTSWFKVIDVEVSGGTAQPPTTPTPTTPTPTPTQPPISPTPTQPPATPTPTPVPTPVPTPTPEPTQPPTGATRPFSAVPGTVYTIGELITHNGNTYRVLQTFTFWGDPNWFPGIAPSLWQLVP
ncbi:MAG: lytic polysaccharide monooxygenase [Turicibacter sp.]|nr:lytic polysaccharide monooxygenase [Turicibacter sp.]